MLTEKKCNLSAYDWYCGDGTGTDIFYLSGFKGGSKYE